MELPLAEEIREARRLADEAQDAMVHTQQVNVTITSIDLLDLQARGGDNAGMPLPGDDVVYRLCERWPQLADLPSTGPRPTQPYREQLRLRRLQMQSALQLLNPIARESAVRSQRLHDLQHEQRHLLEDPKYAEALTEITRLSADRNDAQFVLAPLEQRLSALTPSGTILWKFIERLDWTLADHLSPPGATEWRAALVARDLVAAVDALFNQYRLDLPRPAPVDQVPDAPDPAQSAALLAEVARVRDEFVRLHRAIYAEYLRVSSEAVVARQRFDELTQQITDRMG